jgi:hypothetical protein
VFLLTPAFAVPLIPLFLAFVADFLSLPSTSDIASYLKKMMLPVDWWCTDSLEFEVDKSVGEE